MDRDGLGEGHFLTRVRPAERLEREVEGLAVERERYARGSVSLAELGLALYVAEGEYAVLERAVSGHVTQEPAARLNGIRPQHDGARWMVEVPA